MKRMTIGLCLLLCAQAGWAKGRSSSGWVTITPQSNLDGWTRVAIPPSRPLNPGSQWKVDAVHHVIICQGNRGHEWLRYDHPYKNFVFEVQWRLTKVPGAKNYNSGVFVRNNEDGKIWYQAQVGSTDGGYFFGDNPENGALKRFNLKSLLSENHMRLPGSWNTYKIRCVGKTLVLWVNGVKQSEFTQCSNPKGYVGLEAEGSLIQFRNLKIRELP